MDSVRGGGCHSEQRKFTAAFGAPNSSHAVQALCLTEEERKDLVKVSEYLCDLYETNSGILYGSSQQPSDPSQVYVSLYNTFSQY